MPKVVRFGQGHNYPRAVPIRRLEVHFQIGIRQAMTYSRYQFPLTLSWRTTVHAVQGLTLDRIAIDMKKITSREPGSVYVALSHCKTLDGQQIMSFTKKAIKADQHHHLRQFHVVNYSFKSSFYSASSTDTQAGTKDLDADADSDNDLLVIHSKSDRKRVENLHQETTSMVAALCANSSVPHSVTSKIVQSVDSMPGGNKTFRGITVRLQQNTILQRQRSTQSLCDGSQKKREHLSTSSELRFKHNPSK